LSSYTNPAVNRARIISDVVELDLVDDDDGYDDLELCFRTSTQSTSDTCLAYFDTSRNHWICEDSSLNRDGNFLCGTSDRVDEVFAILELQDANYYDDDDNNRSSGQKIAQSIGFVSISVFVVLALQYLA